MKKLILVLTIISTAPFLKAQKMNFELARKSFDQRHQNEMVVLLAKGDVSRIHSAVTELGGTFKYSAGDIASIILPAKNIGILASKGFIKQLEARTPHIKLLSDSMRIKANVDAVQAGQSPLTQGYDGTGVIIGIIDSGVDFHHPDFNDSITGKTRIKFLWDHNDASGTNEPSPYNYGREWTNTEIDLGQCTFDDAPHSGHGTNSCGIAAGNGKSSPNHKYRGVAPSADLIVVAYDFNTTQPYRIADAADYIYNKAQLLGKPCVINLSLGDYLGSHDGQNLEAQLMNNMLIGQTGRAMVASAGNEGGQYIHAGYTTSATDTNFTWFTFSDPQYIIEFWADTLNFKNVKFAIGADLISPISFRGHSTFISPQDNLDIFPFDTIFNSKKERIAIMQSNTTLVGGLYDISYLITPDSTSANYNWRIMFAGSGKFDMWDYNFVHTGIPPVGVFPDIAKFKMPDTTQTICTSFQCLDNVVTVGNYDNKMSYIDFNGNPQFPYYPSIRPGHIDISSSIGPTRDGRVKPDISAPGALTITTGVIATLVGWQSTNPTAVEQLGVYSRAGGTSAAAPVVAGIAALYLQQNPNASPMDVKSALLACPKIDAMTGFSLPNSVWGYGKVDAFTTLAGCTTAVANLNAKNAELSIHPNPFSEQTTITYNLNNMGNFSHAELRIYDVLGQNVKTVILTDKASQLIVQRDALKSGSYMYNLVIDGKIIKTEKLVVL